MNYRILSGTVFNQRRIRWRRFRSSKIGWLCHIPWDWSIPERQVQQYIFNIAWTFISKKNVLDDSMICPQKSRKNCVVYVSHVPKTLLTSSRFGDVFRRKANGLIVWNIRENVWENNKTYVLDVYSRNINSNPLRESYCSFLFCLLPIPSPTNVHLFSPDSLFTLWIMFICLYHTQHTKHGFWWKEQKEKKNNQQPFLTSLAGQEEREGRSRVTSNTVLKAFFVLCHVL